MHHYQFAANFIGPQLPERHPAFLRSVLAHHLSDLISFLFESDHCMLDIITIEGLDENKNVDQCHRMPLNDKCLHNRILVRLNCQCHSIFECHCAEEPNYTEALIDEIGLFFGVIIRNSHSIRITYELSPGFDDLCLSFLIPERFPDLLYLQLPSNPTKFVLTRQLGETDRLFVTYKASPIIPRAAR